jgi:hypothetical protein
MSRRSALAQTPNVPEDMPTDRRPRLLMAAARHGLMEYRRDRDLPRLLRGETPKGGAVLERLVALEAETEAARREGSPQWNSVRHVELLIALLAEQRLRGL